MSAATAIVGALQWNRKPTTWDGGYSVTADLLASLLGAEQLPTYTPYQLYGTADLDLPWPVAEFKVPPRAAVFILQREDGRRYLVNTEGYNYARYVLPITPPLPKLDARLVLAKAAMDALGALAAACDHVGLDGSPEADVACALWDAADEAMVGLGNVLDAVSEGRV